MHKMAWRLPICNMQMILSFCEAMTGQMLILRVIFIIFEAVSELHINCGKSFIYPVNEVAQVESLAGVLNGRVGELPTMYLGIHWGKEQINRDLEWSDRKMRKEANQLEKPISI